MQGMVCCSTGNASAQFKECIWGRVVGRFRMCLAVQSRRCLVTRVWMWVLVAPGRAGQCDLHAVSARRKHPQAASPSRASLPGPMPSYMPPIYLLSLRALLCSSYLCAPSHVPPKCAPTRRCYAGLELFCHALCPPICNCICPPMCIRLSPPIRFCALYVPASALLLYMYPPKLSYVCADESFPGHMLAALVLRARTRNAFPVCEYAFRQCSDSQHARAGTDAVDLLHGLQVMDKDMYSQLRTTEQLGYIVAAVSHNKWQVRGRAHQRRCRRRTNTSPACACLSIMCTHT